MIHDPEPTVGACFDADWLNLMRVGIAPDARYLNHPQSRLAEMIDRCSRTVFDGADRHQLVAEYASSRRSAHGPH